jgi:uncharacterized protein (TIGR00369 family)
VIGADTVDRPPSGLPAGPSEHDQVLAAGQHLLQQLDFRDVEHDGADLAVELDLDPRVTNPRGALQGGLMATLVDVVAGRAVLEAAPVPLTGIATADLTIHYLKGLTVGPARAVATVVRLGRSLAVVTVEVLDMGSGQLCAVSTVAFSVSPPGPTPAAPSTVPTDRREPGADHQEP